MERRDYFERGFYESSYSQIVEYGTFYFPAWKHYNRPANVVCDRCGKSNLQSCIGYSNKDLCLQCADVITGNAYAPTVVRPVVIYERVDEREREKRLKDICDEVRVVRKDNLD